MIENLKIWRKWHGESGHMLKVGSGNSSCRSCQCWGLCVWHRFLAYRRHVTKDRYRRRLKSGVTWQLSFRFSLSLRYSLPFTSTSICELLPGLKPPSNKTSRRQNLHKAARFPAHASGLRGPTEWWHCLVFNIEGTIPIQLTLCHVCHFPQMIDFNVYNAAHAMNTWSSCPTAHRG